MKKLIYTLITISALASCSKIEETVTETVNTTREKAEQQASDLLKETVSEQLDKLISADTASFKAVFPSETPLLLEAESGRKVTLPNGTPFYVFKYKTADKDLLLKTLVAQPTTDETQSSETFEKVDGSSLWEKLSFFEKFIPENTIDMSFLDEMKNDKSVEYYKIKRFPNNSTLVYNPKNNTAYHFVEVKK